MNKKHSFKKEMIAARQIRQNLYLVVLLPCLLVSFSACTSHLKKAKFHYEQAQKYSRRYQTEDAAASFKRTLKEAKIVVSKNPSSQGYMLKGMAELNLELWEDAEESFRSAHSFGFEKGEEWAQQISLLGLAASLEVLGVEDSTLRIYTYLAEKSKLESVTIVAAQKYTGAVLEKALARQGKDREKLLASALKMAQKLSDKNLSCGFYHYLQSQVYGHLAEYQRSFEEALMARELGLPTEEILRDNDLQIVFCYQRLQEQLSSEDWEEFRAGYLIWVKKWGWKGPETPGWKKER